jgi:hypothetical protein
MTIRVITPKRFSTNNKITNFVFFSWLADNFGIGAHCNVLKSMNNTAIHGPTGFQFFEDIFMDIKKSKRPISHESCHIKTNPLSLINNITWS